MTFQEACAYIESLQKRGWRLGLDRMGELLRLLGDPHVGGPHFYHVAGTNGKGSVVCMIQSVLFEAGYKVGSFYSPYVYDIRERIQTDGRMISTERFAALADLVRAASERIEGTDLGGPTEFEFKTAMGFLEWRERGCDAVVLEVGLGGRLDATNVIEPGVSVITEIGLDHQQHLGDTIELIAAEKAGIVKPRRPCVSGATEPAAQAVIRARAKEECAELWQFGDDFHLEGESIVTTPRGKHKDLKPGLFGRFQVRNMAVAVAALDAGPLAVSEDALRTGISNARAPGRFEGISPHCFDERGVGRAAGCGVGGPLVFLDGAHNPQAALAVVEAIREELPGVRVRLVYSAATGHGPRETVHAFSAICSAIYLCTMDHPRALPLGELELAAAGLEFHSCGSVAEAMHRAINGAGSEEIVLAAGSFYLLAEAKAAVTGSTPRSRSRC